MAAITKKMRMRLIEAEKRMNTLQVKIQELNNIKERHECDMNNMIKSLGLLSAYSKTLKQQNEILKAGYMYNVDLNMIILNGTLISLETLMDEHVKAIGSQ